MYFESREHGGLRSADQISRTNLGSHVSAGSAESRQDLGWFAFSVFAFSLTFRLVIAWRSGFFSHFERDEMVRIALSIATKHGYANPFLIPTGPTAHEMPLYPLFLSVIYRFFGATQAAEAFKIVVACVITALRCAVVPLFCSATQLGRRVAIIAGILSSVYISAVQTELRGNWDGPWQALVLLCLIWATGRGWREKLWIGSTPWNYYLLWGVAILLQPTYATILAAFLFTGWMLIPRPERLRYFSSCVVLGLVIAFLLAPWAVRNNYALGKVVLTRDNFGLEFWVSNGPRRAFDISTNLGFRVPHPSTDVHEAQKVLQMGEVQYNRSKLIEAGKWVSQNPKEFGRITTVRLLAFWFPLGRTSLHRVLTTLLSVLSFFGLMRLFRVNRTIFVLFAICWLCFPLVYYIIQWSSKYRYPIEWQLIVCASLTISAAMDLFLRLGRRVAFRLP